MRPQRHLNRTIAGAPGALAALLLIAVAGCDNGSAPNGAAAAPITQLHVGFISTDSTTDLQIGFEPFIEDMSKSIGMPVKPFYATDYAGIIEGMRFNKVHLAWFGNKSAVEAVDRAGAEVFAQTVAADGLPGYWSVIITHKDGPHQTIDDIIAHGGDLVFGNGDVNSTSGNLVPGHYLWNKRGIDPNKHFKRVITANHQTNLLSVVNGHVDFATNNTENLATFQRNQPRIAESLRVVWKSPMIPLDPMVWRADLPDDLKKKVKGFFMSYGRGDDAEAKRQREVLAGMSSGWAPFNDSSNAQLIPTREMMLAQQMSEIVASTTMPRDEKRARLDELKAKLDDLQKQREAHEAAQGAATGT
jgi:phosphonate transport system substrate-binding protein